MSEPIFNYIIRSTLSLTLLYLFFTLFLGKDKTHGFNRFYLLVSLIFSFVVPLLTVPAFFPPALVTKLVDTSGLKEGYFQIQTFNLQKESQFNLEKLIPILYFSVSLLFLIRFISNLIRLEISKLINPSIEYEGYRIVLINDLVLPFSFLSTIYVNSVEYREGRIPKELFSHEISHITQRHSLDIIFIEIIKVFFWFNPLIYLFKRTIMLNHEYLADEAVMRSKNNYKAYIDIILNIAFRNNSSCLASSFNYSFTKKRLLMITKNNFSKAAIFKKIAVIPLFLALGLLVINAQDTKPVTTNVPPPPPPPPPFGYNTWWSPILAQHGITPIPSKSWFSHNVFETGEQFLKEDNKVTLKGAFILAKSVNDLYRIVRAKSATHSLGENTYVCQGAKVDTYKIDGNKVTTLINTEYYKDFNFRIVEDIIVPPPPPPPPSKTNN